MTQSVQKITLSPSRDIPFNKLLLSACNVRRVKAGVSIEQLAGKQRGKVTQQRGEQRRNGTHPAA